MKTNEIAFILLDLLKKVSDNNLIVDIDNLEISQQKELYELALAQGVVTQIYDFLPLDFLYRKEMEEYSKNRIFGFYKKINFLGDFFKRTDDIQVCVLKGVSVARLYPMPEYRKSNDIDLLVSNKESLQKTEKILTEMGFVPDGENEQNHHVVYFSGKLGAIEIHTSLTEDFQDKKLNSFLKNFSGQSDRYMENQNIFNVGFRGLRDSGCGLELLVHMMQDFYMNGLGLKELLDWTVFWNGNIRESEKQEYTRLVEEANLKRFQDNITLFCIKYLGLNKNKVEFMNLPDHIEPVDNDELLQDILEGGDAGNGEESRMVALQGTGLWALVKEFHHQTAHNFPVLVKVVLLWPLLWIITLVKYFYNNKRLNRPPLKEMLNQADKRGQLVKKMGLTGSTEL